MNICLIESLLFLSFFLSFFIQATDSHKWPNQTIPCSYDKQLGNFCLRPNMRCNELVLNCECYPEVCDHGCPGEKQIDRYGCGTCSCEACGDQGNFCRKMCPLGVKRDESGCLEKCLCNTKETVCKNSFCPENTECDLNTGRCELSCTSKKEKEDRKEIISKPPVPKINGSMPRCRFDKQIGFYCTAPNHQCNKLTLKCECDPEGCPHGCPGKRNLDKYGCPSCTCLGCTAAKCGIHCKRGFRRSKSGCEIDCVCNNRKTACDNLFCKEPKKCKRKTGLCVILNRSEVPRVPRALDEGKWNEFIRENSDEK